MTDALQIMIKRKSLDLESQEAADLLEQAELLGGLTAAEGMLLSMYSA